MAGGYTAWSDKHPAYASVAGLGGNALDDFFSPEINSTVVALPGITTPDRCLLRPVPDPFGPDCLDQQLPEHPVLRHDQGQRHPNEINGKTITANDAVPTLFGMNFQAVSVGQKLLEKSNGTTGGYLDATGTPSATLLERFKFVDASIGEMVDELKDKGL